jgi:glycosyltransferase involved in cell wall biosynthesis
VTEPLVSVGIPTFNRAALLERAAGSVLAQTHARLELVISDNASSDGTEALCHAMAARDSRVRYLRQPTNHGPTANFNVLFAEMTGDYAMVLSDDDWLAEDYLASCLAALLERPDLVLACGVARYLQDGKVVRSGRELQLEQDDPSRRVLSYLRDVDENGVFYGLMPGAVLQRAAPLRNVLGNDWLMAAAVAAQGKIATLRGTFVNRELGGTSADIPKLLQTLRLPRWQARVPHLVIAWQLIADIGWRSSVYRRITPAARARLALTAAWSAINWPSLAWHLTMPAAAAVGRRARGGWVWRAYSNLARRVGGNG